MRRLLHNIPIHWNNIIYKYNIKLTFEFYNLAALYKVNKKVVLFRQF